MCSVYLVDGVCLVWSLLVLVSPNVAMSPHVMPSIPRLRLYHLFGCGVGDWFIVLCFSGSLFHCFVCCIIYAIILLKSVCRS